MPRPGRLLVLLALALAPATVAAQGSSYFGQNHVQFREFDWQILKTEHFDVHYYPELEEVAKYTGQMAERTYARLRRVLGHEFKERKPILIYGSRTEFAQNNVTGDLGEGTGGVTDALRQRNMFFFAGDLGEAEHVLAHEMVHVFQYDVFARGRAGGGMQQLASAAPPLWFMEGMAEYLSVGPEHRYTDAIMRDAALNGDIPTIEQMTDRPDLFFPYRFGESVWQYVGRRWGDEIIGEVMQATPSLGVERAFRRYTGLDLEDLSEEWKEDVQMRFLPQVATLERPRRVASPMLNSRRTGGVIPLYIAPAISPDGKQIAYISTGSLFRAEVFPDLYLADATTGKRLARLTKSTLDADFEELRYAYSQSAFSPDGRYLAFTAQRRGKDVLYIYDLRRKRVTRRLDTPLQAMIGPSWSPDGRKIVFSGAQGGLSDLYVIDADGRNLTKLTNDTYSDLMPQWSPDGRQIAFVSDRGPQTDLASLRIGPWRINVYDLEKGEATTIPGQEGKNLNPMWSPDGQSLAFISDRTGISQVFLYDFAAQDHFQLTKFVGGVLSVTEDSPAMSWAREADKLAFTYHDDGNFTIWSVVNPRQLKKEPFRVAQTPVVAAAEVTAPADQAARAGQAIGALARQMSDSIAAAKALAAAASNPRRRSVYRAADGLRYTAVLPSGESQGVSMGALLDSATLALPDPASFRRAKYKGALRPEYVMRPSVGYAQDNFGRGIFGGTAIVLGDMLGNNRLTLAGQVNGRLSEAYFYGAYMNMGSRLQYMTGASQTPYFFLNGYNELPLGDGSARTIQSLEIARFMFRQGFAIALRPSNRFTRWEYGLNANNVSRSIAYVRRGVDYTQGFATDFITDSVKNLGSLSYVAPYAAYVSDNTLFGYTGAISGRRYRFQVEPSVGGLQWTEYTADYRRYVPILFNFLTFAVRGQSSIAIGKDEAVVSRKYIGRPDFVRGYDREQFASQFCGGVVNDQSGCSATELLGTRVAFANIEMRFPLIRRFDLGLLPISLPPVDGLVFYDAGAAWSKGQSVSFKKPDGYDENRQRFVLRSYGAGIRLNLFGFALVRWDYAIPLDRPNKKGYWMWTLGQSF